MRMVWALVVCVACGSVKDQQPDDAAGSADGPAVDSMAIDAVIDAQGVHVFDVAYPKEWKFNIEGPISGYFLIINSGTNPINGNTLELKSLDDDHSTAIVRVDVNPVDAVIAQGTASGSLSGLSNTLLVGTGLVSEARVNTDVNYLTLGVQNIPDIATGMLDINVSLAISIEGIRIALPMKIHVVPFDGIYADPISADRLPVYRAP